MSKPSSYLNKRDRTANGPPEGEAWAWLTLDMMESAAFRALSHSAFKVLFRIVREHAAQGGKENGRLKVTWRDFQADVHPRRIVDAITEVEALGFAKRTCKGRKAHGKDPGAPAQFRLTWLPIFEPDNAMPASNEWKRFGDDLVEARSVAEKASGEARYRRCLPPVDAGKSAKMHPTGVAGAHPTGVVGAHPPVDAEEKNSGTVWRR